jgi:hypothetical protein
MVCSLHIKLYPEDVDSGFFRKVGKRVTVVPGAITRKTAKEINVHVMY